MNREEAIYYLKSSGMSDEQIKSVIDAFTCDDCISREEAIGIVARIKEMHIDDREQYPINYGTICDIDLALQQLPSVTPQQKLGKWIAMGEGFTPYECSKCEAVDFKKSKYCPNCGAKMEVEE